MGLFDLLKKLLLKKPTDAESPQCSTSTPAKDDDSLTAVDKERIVVQRVTIDDMQQFSSVPYLWNSRIEKQLAPRSRPFAYMNLVGANVETAKSELSKMNSLLKQLHQEQPSIPLLIIPIADVLFEPSTAHGYTRLMCTPVTYSGKPTKHPVSLHFMTDITSEIASTHGELFYSQTGAVDKANIYFWRKRHGYFFYFETVEQELVLSKIESSSPSVEYSPPVVIYKSPHILALEAQREQEEQDYQWLQKYLPEKCPKSLTGYRRMKTQNTKNYQTLKQLAAGLGRVI